ncbi:MAG: tetratricopeptide repeat protein, partial [Burkholderiales bacterium]|nr:tetratricopeptide repeat protein [Burkholderiales bacterium]
LATPFDRQRLDVLIQHVTVGETYFFRDREVFSELEQHILPELIYGRRGASRRIRVWSAGCCTGEEPYSIAIAFARMIPDLSTWDLSILATDLNPRFLQKARRGVYQQWSFRDVPPGVRESWFRPTAHGAEVSPRIKALVRFAPLNLVEDPFPWIANGTDGLDLIFCRNVLMYFERARAGAMMNRLGDCLADGGWLSVSPVDLPLLTGSRLREAPFSSAGILCRAEPPSDTVRPAPPVAHAMPEAVAPFVAARAGDSNGIPDAPGMPRAVRRADPTIVMGSIARLRADRGDLADAEQWCRRAMAADRADPYWCYLLATILQERRRPDEAVDALQHALDLDPDYALAHFALGALTQRRGHRDDAERHFRNALSALNGYHSEQVMPEADGITVGRLKDIIRTTAGGSAP